MFISHVDFRTTCGTSVAMIAKDHWEAAEAIALNQDHPNLVMLENATVEQGPWRPEACC